MTDLTAEAEDNWLLDEDDEAAAMVFSPRLISACGAFSLSTMTSTFMPSPGSPCCNVSFKGRELELYSAYSGVEGYQILRDTPDIALVLLDVVMETDDA
ncbi:hypothetical protein LP420_17990 [Massilia sp. B-10]|nr:hypothetical protein LP420_17990 [Massilia sp. B-10]